MLMHWSRDELIHSNAFPALHSLLIGMKANAFPALEDDVGVNGMISFSYRECSECFHPPIR
jgi:hypothetical protein